MSVADRTIFHGRQVIKAGDTLPADLDMADSPMAQPDDRWSTQWALDTLAFGAGGDGEGDPSGLETAPGEISVPDGSISEVKGWVNGDLRRAQIALDAELAKGSDGRSTLVGWLQDVLSLG